MKNVKRLNLLILLLATGCLGCAIISEPVAHAKKSASASAKGLNKEWESHAENLQVLLTKARSKKLFTPEDAKTLEDIARTGVTIQAKFGSLEEAAIIMFDIATLLNYRERYFEAFDMYNAILDAHGETPIGRKAGYYVGILKKQHPELSGAEALTPAKKETPAKTKSESKAADKS